jgi:hypothetical protein
MDLGHFTGLTIFGLLAAVVYAMCTLALRFFATDSVKVRLLVFCLVFLGLAVPITVGAMHSEVFNAPIPASAASPASAPEKASGLAPSDAPPSMPIHGTSWSLVGLAHAQTPDRWIFCGTLNANTGILESAPFLAPNGTVHSIVGNTYRLTHATPVYDRAPTFSMATFRWLLGSQAGTLVANNQVRIADAQILGQRRVWCRLVD